MLELLETLATDVGVVGVFSDWPATTTFYANCRLMVDDETWYKNGDTSKTCAWVANFVPTRCNVKGFDKTLAMAALVR